MSGAVGFSTGRDDVGPDKVCAALRRLAATVASHAGDDAPSALSLKNRLVILEAAELIERAYCPSRLRVREGVSLIMNIDGAARGNPGPAGIGVMIQEANRGFERKLWKYIGEATNNVAEYEALLLALREAVSLKPAEVRVRSDSELLVRQVQGRYRVRNPRLSALHSQARDLIGTIASFHIEHVARGLNRQADLLANRAIDEALGGGREDEGRT